MSELETRHYIALTPLGRLTMTLGPGTPEAFNWPPNEPMPLNGGGVAYPVSAEIAAEWTADDDDQPDQCTCPGGPQNTDGPAWHAADCPIR